MTKIIGKQEKDIRPGRFVGSRGLADDEEQGDEERGKRGEWKAEHCFGGVGEGKSAE
jgi:hypothetical protein